MKTFEQYCQKTEEIYEQIFQEPFPSDWHTNKRCENMKVEEIPWRDSPEYRLKGYPVGTLLLYKEDDYVDFDLVKEGSTELCVIREFTISSVILSRLRDSKEIVLKENTLNDIDRSGNRNYSYPRFCVITSKYGTGTAAE